MCSGPRKPSPQPQSQPDTSLLLELAAAGDLASLRRSPDLLSVSAPWYGPSSVRHVSMQDRTPLMIASLYGHLQIVSFILDSLPAEATRVSPSDGASPLHLAACGGSPASDDVISLLLSFGADIETLDSAHRRPGDLIPRNLPETLDKSLRTLLKAEISPPSTPVKATKTLTREDSISKKEYPPDLTLPDIKTGIYSTDEFRMYAFKIKPCSRAYSHDWTECPFVHPGENARRRDPRKFLYSCVPCPDFRKGSCRKADACEYAHGVFESWLHPAQYRTRLCKDEVGCKRRICFFAHKCEELRAVNPSAVSVGAGSPRGGAGMDMAAFFMMGGGGGGPGSPIGSPARMKTPVGAREMELELEMLSLDPYAQKLFDKMPSINNNNNNNNGGNNMNNGNNNLGSPRSNWGSPNGQLDPYGSMDAGLMSQLPPDLHPTQLFSNYEPSSPLTSQLNQLNQLNGSGLDHSSMAKAIMNSRASAFAKRSQSFCDRRAGPAARPSSLSVMTSAATSAAVTSAVLSDWASPGGKLDWGVQGEELSKLRKSVSFGFRSGQPGPVNPAEENWGGNGNGNGSGIYGTDPFGAWPSEQEPMRA